MDEANAIFLEFQYSFYLSFCVLLFVWDAWGFRLCIGSLRIIADTVYVISFRLHLYALELLYSFFFFLSFLPDLN
jgi:hypothetical protein